MGHHELIIYFVNHESKLIVFQLEFATFVMGLLICHHSSFPACPSLTWFFVVAAGLRSTNFAVANHHYGLHGFQFLDQLRMEHGSHFLLGSCIVALWLSFWWVMTKRGQIWEVFFWCWSLTSFFLNPEQLKCSSCTCRCPCTGFRNLNLYLLVWYHPWAQLNTAKSGSRSIDFFSSNLVQYWYHFHTLFFLFEPATWEPL
jgi:hypothetical protein